MSSTRSKPNQADDLAPRLDQPRVAIIVPARNEEANIGACLRSLVELDYPSFEIVVVDDDSADGTGEIVAQFAAEYRDKVTLVTNRSLPPGWVGKNHALAKGIEGVDAGWLLFTDADTAHSRDSLSKSIRQAASLGADLFSISPSQSCRTFFERLLQPQVFDFLDRIYSFGEVCDPISRVAAANGQYLLVSRTALEACGGIASIRDELLDDVALAERVKTAGPIWFQPDDGRVATRMYDSARALWAGWRKNLWLLFRRRRGPAARAVLAMLLHRCAPALTLALSLLTLLVFGNAPRAEVINWVAAAWWITSIGGDAAMLRRRRVPVRYALLNWLAASAFCFLLLVSRNAWLAGKLAWKGREYAPSQHSRDGSQQK